MATPPSKNEFLRWAQSHRHLTHRVPEGVNPVSPKPGQESVWDYPRPPRVEASSRHAQVIFAGATIADSRACLRVMETAGAPVYMFPPNDVSPGILSQTEHWSVCEWKGVASYFDVEVGNTRSANAAWAYPDPLDDLGQDYGRLKNYVAFYPARMDRCLLDGETVAPQPGGFYGGWVTQDITGPIKGEPGSEGW